MIADDVYKTKDSCGECVGTLLVRILKIKIDYIEFEVFCKDCGVVRGTGKTNANYIKKNWEKV